MSFEPITFAKLLREAASALDLATDMLEQADEGEIAAPGPQYLLGRLHLAQEVIELELPEFQRAAMAAVAEMLEIEE